MTLCENRRSRGGIGYINFKCNDNQAVMIARICYDYEGFFYDDFDMCDQCYDHFKMAGMKPNNKWFNHIRILKFTGKSKYKSNDDMSRRMSEKGKYVRIKVGHF